MQLDVLTDLEFDAKSGECLIFLSGRSGSGKSTLLKMIYGNYLATSGSLQVKHGDEWVENGGRRAAQRGGIAPPHHRLCEPIFENHPAYRR